MHSDTPDLTWVLVTHRSVDDLREFLPTLRRAVEDLAASCAFRVRVIVADAGSPDDTPRVAREVWPDVDIHIEPDNRGYGATVNAAAVTTSPWLAISNADLTIPDGGLRELPSVLASLDRRVGILGPAMLDPTGAPDAWAGGRAPTLWSLLARRDGRAPRHMAADVETVEWVTGACMFVRSEAWRAAGGFDEEYFLYYEDVDLALRLRSLGWRIARTSCLEVIHRAPHHRRGASIRLQRVIRASRERFFRQHRPAYQSGVVAALGRLRALVDP